MTATVTKVKTTANKLHNNVRMADMTAKINVFCCLNHQWLSKTFTIYHLLTVTIHEKLLMHQVTLLHHLSNVKYLVNVTTSAKNPNVC